MEKLVYTVKEMAEVMSIGLNKAYDMVNSNEVPNIKVGKRIVVPKEQLVKWMAKKAGEHQ